jgi:hypothetical protein
MIVIIGIIRTVIINNNNKLIGNPNNSNYQSKWKQNKRNTKEKEPYNIKSFQKEK